MNQHIHVFECFSRGTKLFTLIPFLQNKKNLKMLIPLTLVSFGFMNVDKGQQSLA